MIHASRNSLIMMTLLVALVLVVFGQGMRHGFTNLDDNLYVSANPALDYELSPSGLHWAFTTRLGNLWMPVTWISFLADRQFFGSEPGPYHRTNILLHLLNTLLLYWIVRRRSGTLWRAGLVAALFAVHPLHVESVAWVAERKDVLSGFFFLLTIRFYLEYSRRPHIIRYMITLLCFALALMSKPMVVTLPVILLLIDYWGFDSQRPLSRLLLEKIPFFALSIALAVITYLLVRTREIGAPDPITLAERLGQAMVFYAIYLGKAFWPTNLSVFYPPESLHFPVWRIAMSALILVVITIWTRQRRHRLPTVWIGWLWFLVMLLPVIGIVQGGMQQMSDRYFYLPSIGLFLMVAWLAAAPVTSSRWLVTGMKPGLHRFLCRAIPVAAIVVVAASAFVSFGQVRVWRSSETLFTHALQVSESDYLSHMNLGVVLDDAGRSAEALPHLQRAVALRKDPLYQFNLANTLSHLGRYAEAIPYYRGAVRLQPDFPTAHNNLAIALSNTGDWTGAGRQFQLAVNQDPDYAGAYYNLGLVQLNAGRSAEAAASFRRTLELDPNHTGAKEQLRQLQGR